MNLKLVLSVLFILSLTSCKNNVEEIYDCFEEVSFAQTIKPIIENNCMECHNGTNNSISDWTTYQEIKNNATAIQEMTFERSMPLNSNLTNDEIEAIYCWVEQGALDN